MYELGDHNILSFGISPPGKCFYYSLYPYPSLSETTINHGQNIWNILFSLLIYAETEISKKMNHARNFKFRTSFFDSLDMYFFACVLTTTCKKTVPKELNRLAQNFLKSQIDWHKSFAGKNSTIFNEKKNRFSKK